ncbi:5-formyltetrahydrofolate cyclo-ligase, partial [Aggregatibacter sp.]
MRSFSSTTTFRQQLRQQMRETRQKQTALQQQQAAQHITEQALKLIEQQQAKNIALYLAFDGEISTKPLINQLWQQGKHVYLPVLHPFVHGH